MRDAARAAQSIVMKGSRARGPRAWISCAIAFLPVPVSPAMSTLASVPANRRICSTKPRIARLLAMNRRAAVTLAPFDALGAAPQAFEPVEHACLRRKDVDHEIEVIEEHPVRLVVPFDV